MVTHYYSNVGGNNESGISDRWHGMTCMGCGANVTRLLKSEPGLQSAEVTLTPGLAHVAYDSAQTNIDKLKEKLADAGYDAV